MAQDLTATDGHHNFQLIPMNQNLFRELAARNNLAIAFDSDAFAVQCKMIDELRHANRRFKLLRLSINGELYHG